MSICQSGIGLKLKDGPIVIIVKPDHPLLLLDHSLPWSEMTDLVLPDLKRTAGKWWLGRKLKLRIHLGVYILQQIYNRTDRQIEYDVKDNAAFQIFAGRNIVDKWHCPDHTKIEDFRTRLSPETQQALANMIAKQAVIEGFADPSDIDIDSTIQEANMSYPSDSTLLCKLGALAKKVSGYLNEKMGPFKIKPMIVDMKKIKSIGRSCFFLPKTATPEEKQQRLSKLYECVKKEVTLVIDNCMCIVGPVIEKMPWNIKRAYDQLCCHARQYLDDVKYFIDHHVMAKGKILSFNIQEACCFNKQKPGKKYQFGRIFQLGRIKGNFLFVGRCESPNQSDKKSIELMMNTHQKIFDGAAVSSVSTDKGYYSAANEKILHEKKVSEIAIQRPSNIKKPRLSPLPEYREEELINRRSGIEPLIGHVKHGGQLGRSRMKSDTTSESSAYASVAAFNMRQLIRHKKGKYASEAA